MAILYDHRGHVGNLSECRLLHVKQWNLVGSWLNGEHLPSIKASMFIIVMHFIRQRKQVTRQIWQMAFLFSSLVYNGRKNSSKLQNTIQSISKPVSSYTKNVFNFLIYKLLIRIPPMQVLVKSS